MSCAGVSEIGRVAARQTLGLRKSNHDSIFKEFPRLQAEWKNKKTEHPRNIKFLPFWILFRRIMQQYEYTAVYGNFVYGPFFEMHNFDCTSYDLLRLFILERGHFLLLLYKLYVNYLCVYIIIIIHNFMYKYEYIYNIQVYNV